MTFGEPLSTPATTYWVQQDNNTAGVTRNVYTCNDATRGNLLNNVVFPEPRVCRSMGHIVDHDMAVITDTGVVGPCLVCGETMQMRRIVGGMATLRLGAYLHELQAGKQIADDRIKHLALDLAQAIAEERSALDAAEELLRQIGGFLA